MDKNQIRHTNQHDSNLVANPAHPNKSIAIEKQKTLDERMKFTVIGNRVTKAFIYCMYLVDNLYKYRQKQFKAPSIQGLTSIEWVKSWNDLKNRFGSLVYSLKSEVVVFIDDRFLGGENELKKYVETKYVYNLRLDYYKEGIQQFANYVKSYGRPCAYLNISINNKPIGTLIFMLYIDIVPQTCQNFLEMCEATNKNGYAGTPIHRIVRDGWIQCGGFHLQSHNELDCENFNVPHDRRGVLCMANDGRHINCSTQFFVLLQPAPWMKDKYVAFGQLIEGEQTLRTIEEVPTWHESPEADIRIYKAGVFDMDCQHIPVNKHTSAYLDSHVEDLVTAGEFFYKVLLENVFMVVDKKRKSKMDLEDIDVRPAKRFMVKNEEKEHVSKDHVDVNEVSSSSSSYSDQTLSSDAGYKYEYEFEVDTHYEKITMETMCSTVVKPEKPFYIPLTDVPYPGEVDSSFDLKKLLRGDYCLESDLETDPSKRKQVRQVPEEKPSALPEFSRKSDDDWEYYLSAKDEETIKKYLRDNLDTVSFAGPYVNKIIYDKLNASCMKESKDSSRSSDITIDQTLSKIPSKVSSNSINVEERSNNTTSLTSSSHKSSSSKIRPSLTVIEYQMKNQMRDIKHVQNKN